MPRQTSSTSARACSPRSRTRRDKDQLATTATLAETPTLKAAFDTYNTEARLGPSDDRRLEAAHQTVTRELEKLAAVTSASVLAILDTEGRVFASAGSARQQWAVNEKVMLYGARTHDVSRRWPWSRPAHFAHRALHCELDNRDIGTLVLGTSLDNAYAEILAGLSRAGIVITVNHQVVARARTVPEEVTRDLVANEGEPREDDSVKRRGVRHSHAAGVGPGADLFR